MIPLEVIVMIIYEIDHASHFSLFLKEWIYLDLVEMFDDALELERNMIASKKVLRSHSHATKEDVNKKMSLHVPLMMQTFLT